MYKPITLVLLILLLNSSVFAQDKKASKFDHSLHIGYNIGGLAPLSFPNTIRKINSYSPGPSPSFGYELNYKFNPRWAIGIGIRADWKSMTVKDSVQYFHTLVAMDDAVIEGDFSGTNATNVRNMYFVMPIQAKFYTKNNWRLKMGGYLAHLMRPSFYGYVADGYLRKGNSLGEKIIIDHAIFNFNDNQRSFDFGMMAGAEKNIYNKISLRADLQWGLQPVFPNSFNGISFNMYNIFGTIGIGYEF